MTDSTSLAPFYRQGTAIPTYFESAAELPARSAPTLGAGWPKLEHRLLLEAACAPGARARAAWQAWRARPNSHDLDGLDTASARLFAQAAPRLRELGCKDAVIDGGVAIYRHTWCVNQVRLRAALHAIQALERAGVASLALKGLALLAGHYPELGLRPMFDLDLLVHPEQLGLALSSLNDAGWKSAGPVPPSILAGEIPRGYSWQLERGRVELDLHWHALNQDASRTLDATVWDHAVARELQGVSVRCPAPTELLLIVCLHGTAWNRVPATLWAADACRLVGDGTAIDWPRLVQLARARHLTLPVYDCLRFLATVLEAPVPATILDELGDSHVLELECMEYAAITGGSKASGTGDRWAMRDLAARRREERLTREPLRSRAAAPTTDSSVRTTVSEQPLVSCVCVTENRPAFIPWLLWSFDRQDWPHRELVIVDSSEPPLELPERPDVRVLRVPPGTALGKKRNVGLEAARGELLAWFDDDDWQHPRRLSLLIEKLKSPTTSADTTHVGPGNGWFVDLLESGATEYRSQGLALFNGSLFVGRHVQAHRFADELRSAEDTFWLRALGQRALAFGDELPPLFFWLCHDSNTSNPRAARHFERSLDELRAKIGDDWGDTDERLAALRERLNTQATTVEAPRSTHSTELATSRIPKLWVVTPCMGRLSFLKRTAPLVLAHPSVHYCVVDYSCPEACGDWLEEAFPEAVRSGRCVVQRVRGETVFNKCAAHNAGARRARESGAEYLCFLDADTIVRRGFFDWLLPRLERERFFVASLRNDGYDVPSLTGLLAVSAPKFAETSGFDESFKGWGSEDIEMRLRLHVLHGLAYGEVPLSFVRPLPHEDALRSSHYEEKNIHRSDQTNFSRMIQKLNVWRRERPFDRQTAGRLFYKPPPVTEPPALGSQLSSPPAPVADNAPSIDTLLTSLPGTTGAEAGCVVRAATGSVVFDASEIESSKQIWKVRLYAACGGDAEDVSAPFQPEPLTAPVPYFEHDALISVIEKRRKDWSHADYIGVLGPDLRREGNFDWVQLGRAVASTEGNYDVYGVRAEGTALSPWRSLGRMESRALEIARHLLVRRLGVPEELLRRRVPLFAQGAFIARTAAFERYVREWLLPARAALEDGRDHELQKLLKPDARSVREIAPPRPWLRLTPHGKPHTSYHPYVLERLAPLFFVHAGYRVRAI